MKKTFISFILILITALFVSCDSSVSEPPELGPVIMQPVPDNPKDFYDISAQELVAQIKIGWNLGNTLDADPNETSWGNPMTKKSNIDTIKNAGFNAVRIPVSWSHHVDKNYNIDAAFMERVKEIVGYAIDNDMYIVLNTHHDEGIFKFQGKEVATSKAAFERIWEQIAGQFKNENEKLIFEGLNEPRTKGSSAEWSGGTSGERSMINEMDQIFTNVVRASDSNNRKRILMVTTYAASAEQAAIDGVKIPNDPLNAKNKFIVSVHSYSPYDFALNDKGGSTWNKNNSKDKNDINTPLNRPYNKFVSKGIPVILGEFGALNKNNESARADWAEYYVSYAKSKGMPCFWWDDGGNFKLLNRSNDTFYFPAIKDALIRGAESAAP